ncbi:MAG TPA: AtpZ/AtpI family protein [Flavobacteriales bacterium]|nr:AtpZ/AtpI family protein [Flavobacteriales bacterium]
MMPKRGSKELRGAKGGYQNYLRYTGLGFSMVGIILAFTFGGWWLDKLLAWKIPVLTILLSLLGVAGSMMYLFKETGR